MNPEMVNRSSGAALGFTIASLLFIVLAVVIRVSVKPPAIDADRANVISKALFQIRTNETASLNNTGWIDRPRGIVRLPIETAMQITARDWQNPEAGRTNLISREEEASAPAPAAPAAANPFQ